MAETRIMHRRMRRVATLVRTMPGLARVAQEIWRLGQARYTVGVVGVVVNARQQVLIVEHVFHPRTPWGLPGGWVGRAETPAEALRREMGEELQLQIEVHQLLLLEINQRGHYDFAYFCQPQNDIGRVSAELLDYRWVDLLDLPRLYPFHYRAVMKAFENQTLTE